MDQDKARFTNGDSRRDFLGKVGAALGGVALAGGGGSGIGRAQGTLPNGYQFYRILDANDGRTYPGANIPNPVGELTAAVMLGSASQTGKAPYNLLYFHGRTTQAFHPDQPTAAFFMVMDYSQSKPVMVSLYVLTYQGATLEYIEGVPNNQLPLVVSRLGTGSCNSLGHYATTIFSQSSGSRVSIKNAPGVYLYDPVTATWTKVARFGDPVQGGGAYGGDFGDVAIDDNDNVTIVAALTGSKPAVPSTLQASTARNQAALQFAGVQALVHAPRERSIRPFVLAQTGDMLPESNAVIRSFGLIDVGRDGSFVAQVSASRVDVPQVHHARPGTAIITGSVGARRGRNGLEGLRLLAAAPHLLTLRQRRQGIQLGACILGPRIGSENLIGLVTHDESLLPGLGALERHRLAVYDRSTTGRVLASTGDLRGRRSVAALSPPSLSTSSNLTYYSEALDDGSTQLLVQSGSNKQVILKSGDPILGLSTTEILYGYHPAQADQYGRIAFSAELLKYSNVDPNDANNILASICVGVPA